MPDSGDSTAVAATDPVAMTRNHHLLSALDGRAEITIPTTA
ncbi:hypothetical protein [Rhodococcus jostii]|nr:hypothetical protein [Rhodococcus jostii]